MMVRRVLKLVGLSVAILASAASAQDSYPVPSRHIAVVVPFAAGTGTDVITRVIAERMAKNPRKRIREAGIKPE